MADVAVFDLKESAYEFLHNVNAKQPGQRKLVAQTVISSGKRI